MFFQKKTGGTGKKHKEQCDELVGGKAFELNQGVWYDSTYRGQSTVNVRRGTDSFRKLDSGLRAIAEGISGTVVTLWKEKAYRID